MRLFYVYVAEVECIGSIKSGSRTFELMVEGLAGHLSLGVCGEPCVNVKISRHEVSRSCLKRYKDSSKNSQTDVIT